FNRNVAYRGAGLVNAGSASLTKCSLSGNTVVYGGLSSDVGGAIFNGYSAAAYYGPGTVSLTDCTISGNYANQNGGGLYNDQHSKAYLSNCTLSKNIAGDGGGLFNKGKAILSNCTLSGNAVSGIAAGHGGGLYNGGAATLINCTVSGNTGDDGGGLFNSGTAALTNCTVSSNKISGSGGGLYNNANVSLTNTIVAGNTADSGGSDVYNNRSLTSLGYNLIGERDGTSGWTKTDLTGTVAKPLNPKLAPLGNNGGPTQTMALLSGSPAIGKGTRVSGVTTDQRGFPLDRPTPDIGAFQSQNVQSTGNQRAVQALYLAALGRAGSVAELDGWASLLPAGATSLTRSVAAGIEGSPEARDHLVQAWYATYLGRQARGGEEQGFVNLLQAGQNEERVLSLVLGSTEYFNRAQALVATGTPRERFVQSLYHLLLGRTAGADEVSGWVTALQGHALTPQGVAFAFLGAPEYRTFVVSDYYDGLLHRLAARKEISGWVNPGLDHFHLRIGFESSGEFFSNG
ncbi:MAG: choice-of-anchor Q domain-containing protein, partial [Isosphaeraceae bacterium]